MADSLFLSLWFPSFGRAEMMPRISCVLRQFPFSAQRPGVSYLAVHPVSWNEPTILERRMLGAAPQQAVEAAADLLHEDYAYLFEAFWDLWTPQSQTNRWTAEARGVKFIVHGTAFDEGSFEHNGHIQVDFGLDTPFLYEDVQLTPAAEERVKTNVQKLVAFTASVEKNCLPRGRVLWSESEDNLAQKLIARLQQVQ